MWAKFILIHIPLWGKKNNIDITHLHPLYLCSIQTGTDCVWQQKKENNSHAYTTSAIQPHSTQCPPSVPYTHMHTRKCLRKLQSYCDGKRKYTNVLPVRNFALCGSVKDTAVIGVITTTINNTKDQHSTCFSSFVPASLPFSYSLTDLMHTIRQTHAHMSCARAHTHTGNEEVLTNQARRHGVEGLLPYLSKGAEVSLTGHSKG